MQCSTAITHIPEAIPKYISERTRYLWACLAFHSYPQVIRPVFNLGRFGPPRGLTPASTCPWIARPVSGLPPTTESPYSDSLSLRLRSSLTLPRTCNSPARYAKSTPSHPKVLRPLVGTRFQVLFHSPSGVLFTFPSRYWFTIGRQGVFSLTGWSPQIPTGFLVPGRTQVPVKEGHTSSHTRLLLSVVRRSSRFS